MAITPYTPKFSHTDWIDNEDRVQAGGENGFNIRFHNLETEFATLAEKHLNPLINSLSTTGPSFLSLIPILAPKLAFDSAPNATMPPAWMLRGESAQKISGVSEAHGIMNITLPDGVEIKSMMVAGSQSVPTDQFPKLVLHRKVVEGTALSEPLITIDKFGVEAFPTGQVIVNNRTHQYNVTADLEHATADSTVILFTFRITYQ
ncbi:hypothetical protein ACFV0O_38850 [Kitasatospora sp. NPDC059577]|uniref:hypothetical protein n=1 Tax=Kitasatospora sp. NPDC059577 TaxID=3346873 RepID=UPI0036B5461C